MLSIRQGDIALARVVTRSIDARQRMAKVNLTIEIYVDQEPQPAPLHFDYPSVENGTEVIVVGSGPAGYTAAIYTGRANIPTILYEGLQPGGQLTITTDIENFPGYPNGISGSEMMDDLRLQAERFGASLRSGIITKADLSQRPFKVTVDDGTEIEAETVIIATGASAKYLGLEDEKKYAGMGVSACATCDGFFYRKKVVAVVGGGDTACEEASYLAGLASKVYLIVRKNYLRASQIMQDRVMQNPKIGLGAHLGGNTGDSLKLLTQIPFLTIALSGQIPYYVEYTNFQANTREFFLHLVEQGARPSFLLTWEDPIELQNTNSADIYSSRFELYRSLISKWYKELAAMYALVGDDGMIVDHVRQGDLVRVTWDKGVQVYINFGDKPGEMDGVTLEKLSYKVVNGNGN